MKLIVDNDHLGTSESAWRDCGHVAALRELAPITAQRVILIAPHPDDEVFGAGGLLQLALAQGIPVEVVAVTDGENSHPGSDATLTAHLAQRRIRESQLALRRLGWADPVVTRLHLPDGRVTTHRPQLQAALEEKLRPGDWCVAPWRRDGHPDHDACGEAAQRASHSAGVRMLGYLVWTWHWATPDGSEIPWQSCQQLRLSRRERARKRWATSAFESQIDSIGSSPSDAPVLPAPVLRRFWRAYEVYVDEIGGPRDVY